jgi:hypothetical protein
MTIPRGLAALCFILLCSALSAQPGSDRAAAPPPPESAGGLAAEMDALLDSGEISYGQAARFILEAAEVYSGQGEAAAEQAFALAAERGWLPKNVQPGTPARLEGVCLLVMGSFDLKGGLMYTLFQTPHYAYREMVYQKLIQGRTDPALPLSGERLLRIIGRTLDHTGRGEGIEAGNPEKIEVGNPQGIGVGAEGLQDYEGVFDLE